MRSKLSFRVVEIDGSIKIRDYLKRLGFSTSLIAKVKYDNVFLNGTAVHMRAVVTNGDIIDVILPEEESENIEPISLPLNVLYEDDFFIAVNKPINMPTHPSRGNHLPTLANAVRAYLNNPFVFRAITRLDRDTSGIVIIAKNQLASAILSEQMKRGAFKKTYYAIVSGTPSEKEGEITAPIKRESEASIKRIVSEDGKASITKYKLLKVLKDGNSLVELIPITGRTHQLRVHMAHIGCPLVGDFLYGERVDKETYKLHCGKLEFLHPGTNEPIAINAPCDFCPDL